MEPALITTTFNSLLADLRRVMEDYYGSRLKELILFGSWARGDASTESDIDILVVLDGPVNAEFEIERTGNLFSDLSLSYDMAISCVFISDRRFANEKSPLVLNVHREGTSV